MRYGEVEKKSLETVTDAQGKFVEYRFRAKAK